MCVLDVAVTAISLYKRVELSVIADTGIDLLLQCVFLCLRCHLHKRDNQQHAIILWGRGCVCLTITNLVLFVMLLEEHKYSYDNTGELFYPIFGLLLSFQAILVLHLGICGVNLHSAHSAVTLLSLCSHMYCSHSAHSTLTLLSLCSHMYCFHSAHFTLTLLSHCSHCAFTLLSLISLLRCVVSMWCCLHW